MKRNITTIKNTSMSATPSLSTLLSQLKQIHVIDVIIPNQIPAAETALQEEDLNFLYIFHKYIYYTTQLQLHEILYIINHQRAYLQQQFPFSNFLFSNKCPTNNSNLYNVKRERERERNIQSKRTTDTYQNNKTAYLNSTWLTCPIYPNLQHKAFFSFRCLHHFS